MITLKQNTEVEIYQVELALKVKTKQSPFIPILILAQEQEEISAEILHENLLTELPLRACENLLKRLEQQGYLQKEQSNMFDYRQTYQDAFANYLLTDFGQRSATDKSFWIGEKGVYNVFVLKSNLVEQRIIRTEKVERAEDNRNTNILRTPNEIRQYENQIITINKTEVLIEDVEEKCFQLKPANCILEIQAKGNETVLKLSKENQLLFQTDIEIEEDLIEEIARLYGFENIPANPPVAEQRMQGTQEPKRGIHQLRHALAGRAYQEVMNFGFIDADTEEKLAGNTNPIKVLNPIASQYSVMRSNLIGGLVQNLKQNKLVKSEILSRMHLI
jgi:hypothetical protein